MYPTRTGKSTTLHCIFDLLRDIRTTVYHLGSTRHIFSLHLFHVNTLWSLFLLLTGIWNTLCMLIASLPSPPTPSHYTLLPASGEQVNISLQSSLLPILRRLTCLGLHWRSNCHGGRSWSGSSEFPKEDNKQIVMHTAKKVVERCLAPPLRVKQKPQFYFR